jgi:hypothetical protein
MESCLDCWACCWASRLPSLAAAETPALGFAVHTGDRGIREVFQTRRPGLHRTGHHAPRGRGAAPDGGAGRLPGRSDRERTRGAPAARSPFRRPGPALGGPVPAVPVPGRQPGDRLRPVSPGRLRSHLPAASPPRSRGGSHHDSRGPRRRRHLRVEPDLPGRAEPRHQRPARHRRSLGVAVALPALLPGPQWGRRAGTATPKFT